MLWYCHSYKVPFEIRTGFQIVQPYEYWRLKSPVFRWIWDPDSDESGIQVSDIQMVNLFVIPKIFTILQMKLKNKKLSIYWSIRRDRVSKQKWELSNYLNYLNRFLLFDGTKKIDDIQGKKQKISKNITFSDFIHHCPIKCSIFKYILNKNKMPVLFFLSHKTIRFFIWVYNKFTTLNLYHEDTEPLYQSLRYSFVSLLSGVFPFHAMHSLLDTIMLCITHNASTYMLH